MIKLTPQAPPNTVNEPDFTVRSTPRIASTGWKLLRTPFSSSCATLACSNDDALTRTQQARLAKNNNVPIPPRGFSIDRS